MEHRGKVLFLSGSVMPSGSAYSTRIEYISKLLISLGYQVHVISDVVNDKGYVPGEVRAVDEITYQGLTNKPTSTGFFKKVFAKKCLAATEQYLEKNKIDFVVFNAYSDRYSMITELLKEKSIPYCLEMCEWRNADNFKLGFLNPIYRRTQRHYKHVYIHDKHFIGISRLLCNYFDRYGLNTLRLPTIFDVENQPWVEKTDNQVVRLIYAGSPGKSKEEFREIVLALKEVNAGGVKIMLDIYGSTREHLDKVCKSRSVIDGAEKFVFIHGRQDREVIQKAIRASDFMIFLRKNKRSNNAGFPTKLAESMMNGTPVITNDTGDISLYLKNGENGYLLKRPDTQELISVLKCIVQKDDKELAAMRTWARRTAEQSFDYRTHLDEMNAFANRMLGK